MYSLLPGSPVCECLLSLVAITLLIFLFVRVCVFGLLSGVVLSCTVREWLVSLSDFSLQATCSE